MNRVVALFALVVACCVVLFYTFEFERDSQQTTSTPKLFESLVDYANKIDRIELESSQGLLLSANLNDAEGQVSWMSNHMSPSQTIPLDKAQVDELLSALSAAKIVAQKTSDKNKYALLQLESIDVEASKAVQVTISAAGRQWKVLVGKTSDNQNGSFVRLPNEAQTYLIDKAITLPASSQDWFVQPLLAIEQSDIQRLSVTEQKQVNFERTEDDSLDVQFTFMSALTEAAYENVLTQDSVLLDWFTEKATRVIEIETSDTKWQISLFKNEESEQVWATVNSDKPAWQTAWAFELSDYTAEQLLIEMEKIAQN